MELGGHDIVFSNDGSEIDSGIIRSRKDMFGVFRIGEVAMDEIKFAVIFDFLENRMLFLEINVVPSHLGDFDKTAGRFKHSHRAGQDIRAVHPAVLFRPSKGDLCSKAYPQERHTASHGFPYCRKKSQFPQGFH